MEENEFETTTVATDPQTSKMSILVPVFAIFGAGVLAKKGFDKVRGLRVIRKDTLDELKSRPNPTK